MPTRSGFYQVVRPKGLVEIGAKRAPGLEDAVRKQIRALENLQREKVRNLRSRGEGIDVELRRAEKWGEKIGGAAGVDVRALQRDAREKVARYREHVAELKLRGRPKGTREHNPTRYPPYDYWWYSYSWWGASPTHTFAPTLSDGRSYINASCLEPAGGVVGSSGLAIWYFSQASGTLAITAQTSLYGACEAVAWAIPWPMGYVNNESSLRVGAWTGGIFSSASLDYYYKSGVSVYDFYTGFSGKVHTLTHYIPVSAGTWYLLWAIHDTSQVATGIASTATNIGMYVNDFVYFMI